MRNANLEKFYDVLDHFDVVMLVTRSREGELRARPMVLVDCDARGDLWLVSDSDAEKLDEVHDDPRVNIAAQSSRRYLSLSGVAEVVTDPEQMRRHATERIERWLAEFNVIGRDTVLLRIVPQDGEYWDQSEREHGDFVYETAKNFLTDSTTRIDTEEDAHAKVRHIGQRTSPRGPH